MLDKQNLNAMLGLRLILEDKQNQSSLQDISSEICMIDGSWTHDSVFSCGCGWEWENSTGKFNLWELEIKGEEFHLYTWSLRCFLRLWNACYKKRNACYNFRRQLLGTYCKNLISMKF